MLDEAWSYGSRFFSGSMVFICTVLPSYLTAGLLATWGLFQFHLSCIRQVTLHSPYSLSTGGAFA